MWDDETDVCEDQRNMTFSQIFKIPTQEQHALFMDIYIHSNVQLCLRRGDGKWYRRRWEWYRAPTVFITSYFLKVVTRKKCDKMLTLPRFEYWVSMCLLCHSLLFSIFQNKKHIWQNTASLFSTFPGAHQFNSHIFIKFNMPSRSSFCLNLILSFLFSTRMWYSCACHASRKSWTIPQQYRGCEKTSSEAAPQGADGLWPRKLVQMALNAV